MAPNDNSDVLPTSKALHISLDDNPNLAVYKKMEKIVERMQKVRLIVLLSRETSRMGFTFLQEKGMSRKYTLP